MHWYLGIVSNPDAILPADARPSRSTQPHQQTWSNPSDVNAPKAPQPIQSIFSQQETPGDTLVVRPATPTDAGTRIARDASEQSTSSTSSIGDRQAAGRARIHSEDARVEDSEDDRRPNGVDDASDFRNGLGTAKEQFEKAFSQSDKEPSKIIPEEVRPATSPKDSQNASSVTLQRSTHKDAAIAPAPIGLKCALFQTGTMFENSELIRLTYRSLSIAFDSLGGSHSAMHKTFKTYFLREACQKKNIPESALDIKNMHGVKAKVRHSQQQAKLDLRTRRTCRYPSRPT